MLTMPLELLAPLPDTNSSREGSYVSEAVISEISLSLVMLSVTMNCSNVTSLNYVMNLSCANFRCSCC